MKIKFVGGGMGNKFFSDLKIAEQFATELVILQWVESAVILKKEDVVVAEF